jgi:heme-degrading monooxygenase HmoA
MIAELRSYTVAPGRGDALMAQFQDVSLGLFARHGIRSYGPWFRELRTGRQLVYVLEFDDEQDRATRWSAFREDPDWQAAQQAGEADGPLIAGSEIVELVR